MHLTTIKHVTKIWKLSVSKSELIAINNRTSLGHGKINIYNQTSQTNQTK